MGHSIVGVDVSEQALKEFFADQGLPYREEPVPGISGAKKLQVCLLQCQTVCCVQPCTARHNGANRSFCFVPLPYQ